MTAAVSAVIPVKDGARYLAEVLAALGREGVDEVLVVDSGSRDGSVALARAAGATVLEIAPEAFGHGRTRNLAAERARGDVLAFLTQDATPVPGWLAALREALALSADVGAVFGPHLPRPGTSPMIARELTEFFATFPVGVFGPDDPTFLSNVGAAYRRACWAELRFADVAYSEDQAFGRALAAHPRWRKAYAPGFAVLHAHDYPPLEFARRYFDEYRGLRETLGHVERIGARSTVRDVRGLVAADRRWLRGQGASRRAVAGWTGRSLVHHTSRKAFSALGSRAGSLPPGVQRRLSLERRAAAAPPNAEQPTAPGLPPAPGLPALQHHPAAMREHHYAAIARFLREGSAPLLEPVPGMAGRERLHVAFAIPPFSVGSGGHAIVFQLVARLEELGHTCSIWVHDPFGHRRSEWPAVKRRAIVEHFAPVRAPVFEEFDRWFGADVAVATGWETVYPVLGLQAVRARAYLVNDHEPEFFATSAEAAWARETYRQGLHGICGSPWLRDLYVREYGGHAGAFQYGVDHAVYRPRAIARREDTVVFYARTTTPRRAVALGALALHELWRRREGRLRVVTFGDRWPLDAPFPTEHAGVASPEQLSWLFSEATVGLALSLTNYSLVPQEMLTCGLPCVDLEGASAESVFGRDGPVELAPFDPGGLADALERLLDDPALRARRADEGRAFVAPHSWAVAGDQVEAELRTALRLREEGLEVTRPQTPPGRERLLRRFERREWERAAPLRALGSSEATDALWARAGEDAAAAVDAALDPEERALVAEADAADARRAQLTLGVHHRVPALLERTGLSPAEPPPAVHAMARGALAAGGDPWYADLVAAAVRRAGADPARLRAGLDFGCSSGRVVRMLAAAFPAVDWHGCDPNEGAIAWAREHLPAVRFRVSPQLPPTDYADGAFDLVLAVSVFSHFRAPAALAWLAELERLLAPGGLLVLTTHGDQSVAHDGTLGLRPPAQLAEIAGDLYREGTWYAPEFGEAGDHGVVSPDWGTAFLTPEWLAAVTHEGWELADLAPGIVERNQDLYVLRRRT